MSLAGEYIEQHGVDEVLALFGAGIAQLKEHNAGTGMLETYCIDRFGRAGRNRASTLAGVILHDSLEASISRLHGVSIGTYPSGGSRIYSMYQLHVATKGRGEYWYAEIPVGISVMERQPTPKPFNYQLTRTLPYQALLANSYRAGSLHSSKSTTHDTLITVILMPQPPTGQADLQLGSSVPHAPLALGIMEGMNILQQNAHHQESNAVLGSQEQAEQSAPAVFCPPATSKPTVPGHGLRRVGDRTEDELFGA